MKEFILFPHGGCGNHGCEAIVRTTCNMLSNEKTVLFSSRPEEDKQYGIDAITQISEPTKSINKYSVAFVKAYIQKRFLHQSDALDALSFSPVISRITPESVLISIGGDNYCYGENEFIYMVNRYAKKRNARTVLWGCSVEPDAISQQMKSDLESYDLIVARESISFAALKKINNNTVLKPDPAFTLEVVECSLPPVFQWSNVVGINLSPLIVGSEKVSEITFRNYIWLIKFILSNTSYSIALIPHVVWETSDDRKILRKLKSEFADTERVVLVEDHTASELKYIISKCELFVGARTHATIAAYSTFVPTLVVGYSVKAKGIAKDLFSSYEKYVFPVQKLVNENDLTDAFKLLIDNQSDVKKHLQKTMPTYIQNAYEAGKLLTEG